MDSETLTVPRANKPEPLLEDRRPEQATGRRGYGWVWLVVLAGLGVAGYFLWPHLRAMLPAPGGEAKAGGRGGAGRAVPVVVATVRRGDMDLYINGLGTAQALNTVTVRSRVDGQLVKVAFTEGELVKEGQPLIEVDPRPFEVALAQAQGQLAKDEAQLKNAKADLERYQSIRDSVTQQQIDTQAAQVGQYEGAVKIDQAQIDNAKLELSYCHITAPISGRIGLRLVDQGNMVHANDPNGLAVITQLQPIAVVFNIPQDDIPRVMKRMSSGAALAVEAYDRDLKVKLATGTLAAVDNQVDQASGTVRLKATFPNEDGMLFPNQFVNARLLVDTRRDVVIVPSAGVQHGPDSTFAYVVNGDSVEMRTVQTGPTEGDDTVIESGLEPGEIVVTDGVDKLQSGTKVTMRGGASSRPAGAGTQPGMATTAPSGPGGKKSGKRGGKK